MKAQEDLVSNLKQLFGLKKKEIERKYKDVEELRSFLRERDLVKEEKKESIHPIKFFFINFPVHVMRTVIRTKNLRNYRALSNALFGEITLVYPDYFEPLENSIVSSDISSLPESYIGMMSGASFLAAVITALLLLTEGFILGISPLWIILGLLILPLAAFAITFSVFYIYPFHRLKEKKRSIDTNLAFATNHMAAIASSGVPPQKAFEMLSKYKEYGAISKEAEDISKNVAVLGEDLTTAIHKVAVRTPSESFKEILYGILSVIESGGNLKDYLNKMAKDALFDYKLRRRRYLETLSTYADIYTAILIAAPLFLVAILAVISIVPGSSVAGLSVERFLFIGIYVLIPLLNIAFLLFVNYTQPET